MKNRVIAIAAIAKGTRGLGFKNNLLWNIPGDLPRFKVKTTGHPIIMGYNTFKSLPRVLPNRTNIVMVSENGIEIEGATVVRSPEEALEVAKKSPGSEEIYIIGGGMIYSVMLPFTDELDLTIVNDNPEADVFFPDYSEFSEVATEEKCEEGDLTFTRTTLRRPTN